MTTTRKTVERDAKGRIIAITESDDPPPRFSADPGEYVGEGTFPPGSRFASVALHKPAEPLLGIAASMILEDELRAVGLDPAKHSLAFYTDDDDTEPDDGCVSLGMFGPHSSTGRSVIFLRLRTGSEYTADLLQAVIRHEVAHARQSADGRPFLEPDAHAIRRMAALEGWTA